MFKKLIGDSFKKQSMFTVIGGKNLLPKASGNTYLMVDESKEYGEGVVKLQKKLFYFLGSHKEEKHTRSAGKAAAGAIVGGVLTGGIGAIAGAAIGGRKKDDSVFFLDFSDYETKEEFTVQVKPNAKMSKNDIADFRIALPSEIGLEE